jgi:hypothetical protein
VGGFIDTTSEGGSDKEKGKNPDEYFAADLVLK